MAALDTAQLQGALLKVVDPVLHQYAQTSIPVILKQADADGVTDEGQVAYILATTERESNFGEFMHELPGPPDARTYFDNMYSARTDLGNHPGTDDGYNYRGRGFVQITGRLNYSRWSKMLNIDLLGNPDQAARPEIAAKILVRGMRDGVFTGHRLGEYVKTSVLDFVNARRIINGLDHADEIAGRAKAFFVAFQ